MIINFSALLSLFLLVGLHLATTLAAEDPGRERRSSEEAVKPTCQDKSR